MIATRKLYINKLISLMNNHRVKIITGIRRCGKSFLLKELFADHLRSQGIAEDHIIYLPLDDLSNNHLLNPLILNEYIRGLIKDQGTYYIMIDEIQRVISIVNPVLTNGKIVKAKKNEEDAISFVNIILGLMQLENLDIYISGSNSRFLSKDIMTEFRDRGDELHIQPLSFAEYVEAYDSKKTNTLFNEYLLHGGMPMILSFDSDDQKEEYLKNLFKLTYHKDVEERNNIRNTNELETLTKVMASNVGSLINTSTIANTFRSEEKSNITKETIDQYLGYLEDAFILTKVSRIDIRGRKHIGATYKYYYADPGLRNARLDFLHRDDGHVMENIIYNELIRRGYSIQIGVVEVYSKDENNKTVRTTLETDFVASLGSKCYYIQSAYRMDTKEKEEQERRSLINIQDSFKKIIVTRDDGPVRRDEYGIVYMGIERFLLDENSLEL